MSPPKKNALTASPSLTSLVKSGGCGCKLPKNLLNRLLQNSVAGDNSTALRYSISSPLSQLLVGNKTDDDAAVWQLTPNLAIVATVDFFAPPLDDPTLFGQIAATNAISDVYAMGGKPLFALALTAMPKQLSEQQITQVLSGGVAACAAAGIAVVGGHSIAAAEPLYGLAVIGQVHPKRLLTNAGGRGGDVLLLTKPLGVGVMCVAQQRGLLQPTQYKKLAAQMCQLNKAGEGLAAIAGVHALTDVTGFGLLGHLQEMCLASDCGARLDIKKLPLISGVKKMIAQNINTGAQKRNWENSTKQITTEQPLNEQQKIILSDPQTSGGLLIACHPASVEAVQRHCAEFGQQAVAIGALKKPSGHIEINAK